MPSVSSRYSFLTCKRAVEGAGQQWKGRGSSGLMWCLSHSNVSQKEDDRQGKDEEDGQWSLKVTLHWEEQGQLTDKEGQLRREGRVRVWCGVCVGEGV